MHRLQELVRLHRMGLSSRRIARQLLMGRDTILHIEAFEHFGGVPAVIVPDNLKAPVVRCAFSASEDPVLNRSYREFARHYGFQIDPTPPRSPQKKAKVERSGRYVKESFLATWEGEDIDADRRVHGTLKRRRSTSSRSSSARP